MCLIAIFSSLNQFTLCKGPKELCDECKKRVTVLVFASVAGGLGLSVNSILESDFSMEASSFFGAFLGNILSVNGIMNEEKNREVPWSQVEGWRLPFQRKERAAWPI